jgi:uncharacterized protein YbjQ (UPF0145 family)
MLSVTTPTVDGRRVTRYLGADAVLSVDLDYETIQVGGAGMLMVSVSGTAVVLG